MAQYEINFQTNASSVEKDLALLQKKLSETVQLASRSLKINLDTSGLSNTINTTFRQINKEIESNQRKLSRLQIGGAGFQAIARRLGEAEGKRERGQMIAEPIRLRAQAGLFEPGSLVATQKVLQALRIEASQVKPNSQEWVRFQQQIGDVALQMQRVDKAAESIQLTQQLGALAPGSLASLETRLTILRNRAREISPNTTEWAKLNKEIQKTEAGIEKVSRKPLGGRERLGAAGGAFLYGGGLGGGIGSALGGITGGLVGGVPGAFAGAAVGQIADNLGTSLAAITKQASTIQQLQRGLALASIDAKDFAEAQATVVSISERLLMPLEQTTRLFTQLRVNTKQYNLSVADTAQIMEGTALAIASTGGSAQDMEGAMRAVVQILSKGGVQAEELRGQLGERFPGAVVKFAQANKMSFEQLQDALQKGQVGIAEFVTFAKSNYEDYAEFSKQLATAPEFAGQRLQIALEQVAIAIGSIFAQSGADIQDILTNTLREISSFVKTNEKDLKALAEGLTSLVLLAKDVGRAFMDFIGRDIANAFVEAGKALTAFRNLLGKGSIGSIASERENIAASIKQRDKDIAAMRAKGGWGINLDLMEAEFMREQLQKRLKELDKQFKDMGGNAALNAARGSATYTYGGAGAGASMTRTASEDDARKAADKAQKEQERLDSQNQQRILAEQELRSRLNDLDFEKAKTLAEQMLEHKKNMTDAEFSYREARANELQAFELRLEKQLSDARMNSEKAIQDAMLRMQEARLNVQAAADKAAAAKAADAAISTGNSGSLPGGARTGRVRDPDAEATGYDIVHPGGRGAAIRTPVPLTITGTGFQGSGAGSSGRGYGNWITGEFEMGGKKFELLVAHFDRIDVAKGMQVPAGTSLGTQGITGRTFGTHASTHVNPLGGASTADAWNALESLTRSWEQGATGPMSGTAFSTEKREEAAANELVIATRQQEITQVTTLLDLSNKLAQIRANLRADIAQSIGTAFPVAQMKLENDLLIERNQLLMSGASEAEIEMQMQRSRALANNVSLQNQLNKSIADNEALLKKYAKLFQEGKMDPQAYAEAVDKLNLAIVDNKTQLTEATTQFQGFNFELARTKEINDSMEPQLQIAAALREARDELAKLAAPSNQIITIANGIGSAFSEAFTGLISGASSAREVMANFFKSLSDMFAQMVAQIIADWIRVQAIDGLRKIFGIVSSVGGGLAGTLGSSASSIGFGGSFDAGIGGLTGIPDYSGAFTGFATGGVVTGPTLGLVGEGRYNEAIVPLPDGRSIPVDLGGGMGGSTNVVVNVDAKGTKVQGDEPNANQLGRVVSAAVQAELIKQKRPGGLLSA